MDNFGHCPFCITSLHVLQNHSFAQLLQNPANTLDIFFAAVI